MGLISAYRRLTAAYMRLTSACVKASCIFGLRHHNTTTPQFWAYLQIFAIVTACVQYFIAFGCGCAQRQLVAVPPSINQNMRWWNILKRNLEIVTVINVYQLVPLAFGSLFLLLPCVDLGDSGRRFMYQVTEFCGWDSSVMVLFALATTLGLIMGLLNYKMFGKRNLLRRVLESHSAFVPVSETPRPHPPIRAPQRAVVNLIRQECGAEMAERTSLIVEVANCALDATPAHTK